LSSRRRRGSRAPMAVTINDDNNNNNNHNNNSNNDMEMITIVINGVIVRNELQTCPAAAKVVFLFDHYNYTSKLNEISHSHTVATESFDDERFFFFFF
jgi:hypothetical protein